MPIGGAPGRDSQERKIQTLEEVCSFLKIEKSPEEQDFDAKKKKAADLMSAGKMDEAMKLMTEIRDIAQKYGGEKAPKFTDEQFKAFEEARGKIVEELGYTIKTNEGKWMVLEKDGYRVQVKHFMVGSTFGVKGGRISELQIDKDKIYAVWDNGWGSKKPTDAGVKKIFEELVQYIN